MWALSEVREKVYNFQKLPLDKSHFITEVLQMDNVKDEVYLIVDKYDEEVITLLKENLSEYEILEEESFVGEATIVFIVTSVIALANSKSVKAIIEGLFEKNRIKIEYNGLKIEGSYENVQETIKRIKREECLDGEH